jgi:hypothetical protein
LSASLLHDQAIALYGRRGKGVLAFTGPQGELIASWDETNKATYLLCAFALENAIKAFLIYEHPEWVSDGYLHHEVCSHRLVELSEKSILIPYKIRSRWVLSSFEQGNESWMRYPCPRSVDGMLVEPDFPERLWVAYLRVMAAYGRKLKVLLEKGWRGKHGFEGKWIMTGEPFGGI